MVLALRVDRNLTKSAIQCTLLAILACLMFSVSAYAGAEDKSVAESVKTTNWLSNMFSIDRLAVKTNAVDWMLTIPNIGVEYDLTASEYNSMTIGLSTKYNWETYHKITSPYVFNLFDIRPEFRYYYRQTPISRVKSDWTLKKFLKEQKNPIPWRAYYVGGYVNYSSYAIKLGQKGYQGPAIGFGASAGYGIPMYEYKSGVVDVEFGFSVGLQVTKKGTFVYNPYGEFFTGVIESSDTKMGLTPFPVVSDVRVAFVWRHKSIKDKVKEDTDKNKVERLFNVIKGDYNYNDYTKEWYDENLENTKSSREKREIMASDSLYRSGYYHELDEHEATLRSYIPNAFPSEMKEDPRVYQIIQKYEAKLEELIVKNKKVAIKQFEAVLSESKKKE